MAKTVDDSMLEESGIVKKHRVQGDYGKYLREMRLINGTKIELERKAPFDHPSETKLQGFSLTLRKEDAK